MISGTIISPRKFLTPAEAALIAGVTSMTITRWAVRFGIGFKRVGRWQINVAFLQALLEEPELIERSDDGG